MALREHERHWSVTIRTESEAWDLLQRALAGEFADKPLLPQFEGWPAQEITFWLGDKHEVLTAPMLRAMLDYQDSIYRTAMFLMEDTTSLRGLGEEFRIEFEMDFQVGEGCTKLLPDLENILEKIGEAAVAHMTGTELTITILGIALIFGSSFALKAYLKFRSDQVAKETRSETTRRLVESQRFASLDEIERLRIVTDALLRATGSTAISDVADEAKASLLKAASRMDETQVGDVAIDPFIARRLSRNPRGQSEQEQLEGFFDVLRTDTEPESPFRVKLRHRETDEVFFANIRDALLAGDDRDIIAAAEWDQQPFWGQVEVRRRRGEITSAVIISARPKAA